MDGSGTDDVDSKHGPRPQEPKPYRRTRVAYLAHYLVALVLVSVAAWSAAVPALALALLALVIVIAARVELEVWGASLLFEENAVTEHRGILSRHLKTTDFEDVSSVRLEQSVLQRVLGFGTLHINTVEEASENVDEDITFDKLRDPLAAKKALEDILWKRGYLHERKEL